MQPKFVGAAQKMLLLKQNPANIRNGFRVTVLLL